MSDSIKHLTHFSLDYIFSKMQKTKNTILLPCLDGEYRFRVKNTRLKLFSRELKCCDCGIEGNIFVIDQNKSNHITEVNLNRSDLSLNLYHLENGIYTLMTQDHIIPIDLGGTAKPINLQTLCAICNSKKSNKIRQKDIRRLASSKKGRNHIKKHMNTLKRIIISV